MTNKTTSEKLGKMPTWNLSDLYSSIETPEIQDDLADCEFKVNKFVKKYQGKVKKLSGEELFLAIAEYEIIEENMGKLLSFSHLKYAEDLSNSDNTAFYQNISEKISEISSKIVFFGLEINKLSDRELEEKFSGSIDLQRYRPYIRDSRVFKKHQLSKDLEKILLEKSVTGRNAWNRLFDETMDNMEFIYEKKKMNSSEILNLLSNKNEDVRKKAAKIFGNTLGKNVKIFAYITNVLTKDKAISDKWRKYKKPISSRNLSNFIEDEVVESLVKTVKANYPNISHRYYKIKADMLSKKKLHYSDRNAPLPHASDEIIPWKEAKEIVLTAYESFSPKLAELGKQFFDNNWIDVPVRKGKQSGAFAHPCIPSVHPYLLLNYQGKPRDVMTLAHELGHGVHMLLAGKQGYLMSDTPLTLAETASVFGEQLAFRELLKREEDPKKKKIILAEKIEDMIATVIRQIAFLEFERKIHDERKNGEIPVNKICDTWLEVQKESLGDIFIYDDEYKYYWSYIPHFIHTPFYVYSYAFGDCLVNSLYATYKDGLPDFEEKYFDMLSAGGTKRHKELLAPFGLDASRGTFWQKGIGVISRMIDELENQNK